MSSMVLVQMPKAVVSIDRIEEILDVTSEIKDKEGLKDNSYYEDILKQNPVSLTFDNVCFRYPENSASSGDRAISKRERV